jgi:hypothetical protein
LQHVPLCRQLAIRIVNRSQRRPAIRRLAAERQAENQAAMHREAIFGQAYRWCERLLERQTAIALR